MYIKFGPIFYVDTRAKVTIFSLLVICDVSLSNNNHYNATNHIYTCVIV